jgi:hypothetical protein
MVRFLCQFQQVDVNLGPGCKNLTLNRRFLPFEPPDTLTILESTQNQYQPGMGKKKPYINRV